MGVTYIMNSDYVGDSSDNNIHAKDEMLSSSFEDSAMMPDVEC